MARIWQNGFEHGTKLGYNPEGVINFGNFNAVIGSGNYGISESSRGGAGKSCYVSGWTGNMRSDDRNYMSVEIPNLKSMYISFYVNIKNPMLNLAPEIPEIFFALYDGVKEANVYRLYYSYNSAGDINISFYNIVTDTTEIITVIKDGVWYKFDIHLDIDNKKCQLKIDGKYTMRIDQLMTKIENPTITELKLGTVVYGFNGSATAGSEFYIDDMKINDTTGDFNNSWCTGGAILDLFPVANGSVIENPESLWEYICEVVPNIANYNLIEDTGKTDLFKITSVPDEGELDCKVQAIMISSHSLSDGINYCHVLNDGTNLRESETFNGIGTWKGNYNVIETRPNGTRYSLGDVNNWELGYKSK